MTTHEQLGPDAGAPGLWSRRRLLTTGAGMAGALILPAWLAACGSDDADGGSAATGGTTTGGAAPAAASGTVSVLGFSNYDLPEFSTDDVSVKWTPLATTSELYTKTAQAGTFDIAQPADVTLATMVDLGRLDPLDESRIPNFSKLAPEATAAESSFRINGELYGVPMAYYFVYTLYDKKQMAQPPKVYEDLLAPELKGKLGLADDIFIVLILGQLAGFNTGVFTEEQLEQIQKMLNQLKPQVASVYAFGSEINLMARGEIAMTPHSFLNGIANAREAGIDAGWANFGSYGGLDIFTIVKGAKNPDAAYEVLNRSLDEAVQTTMADKTYSHPVITGAGESEVTKEFGTLQEAVKNAPIVGAIPPKGSDGKVGFAEWSQVFEDFKASL